MGIAGMNIGIVGGSIAGCATAIALTRAGCRVEVFERSTDLQDYGSGIAIPVTLRDELCNAGYLDPEYATCEMASRRWIVKDGEALTGRVAWQQESVAASNNWGNMWRSLRAQVPNDSYRPGLSVEIESADSGGVRVQLTNGSLASFDAIVGADGYRSSIRRHVNPRSKPEFAGYVLWRGNYPESRIANADPIADAEEDNSWFTVCFPGGHGVFYWIPGFEGSSEAGHRRMNWAIYAPPPPGLEFADPSSMPPGSISDDLYAVLAGILESHFPPYFQDLVRLSPQHEVSMQPIYDELVDCYVRDHLLLIGDAGTVTRPHTGSGATKALQDALALEQLARDSESWDEMAAAYDAERVEKGNALVELGKRIGRSQVEETPPWSSMTPADFHAWTRATLAGEQLYLYGKGEPQPVPARS